MEYGWSYVAEPYRKSTLTLINVGIDDNNDTSSSFEWWINGHIQGYGRSIDVMFIQLGENEVEVYRDVGEKRSSRGRRRGEEERSQNPCLQVSHPDGLYIPTYIHTYIHTGYCDGQIHKKRDPFINGPRP